MRKELKRVYVRRYSDNGQVVAYVEWADGSRTEGSVQWIGPLHGRQGVYTFGAHMHALFQQASREGLKLQRETW